MKLMEKVTEGAVAAHSGARSLYLDLALMSGFGILLAFLKIYDKSNLQMPGVTGIYWVTMLLLSRGSTGRSWGGAFTGGAASLGSLAMAPVAALAATGITIKFVVTGVVIDLLAPVFGRLKGLPMPARTALGPFVKRAIARKMKRRDSADLLAAFESADVPATRVLRPEQTLDEPQFRARGFFDSRGFVRAPLPGARHLSGDAPALGEHTDEVLQRLTQPS